MSLWNGLLANLFKFIILIIFNIQKCYHRLSDQRRAVNQGQNPLPIYLALNVKDKVTTKDFRGNNVPFLGKDIHFYSVCIDAVNNDK